MWFAVVQSRTVSPPDLVSWHRISLSKFSRYRTVVASPSTEIVSGIVGILFGIAGLFPLVTRPIDDDVENDLDRKRLPVLLTIVSRFPKVSQILFGVEHGCTNSGSR